MKILVVDLDNTLFDTRARYNACLAQLGVMSADQLKGELRREFWRCYQSPTLMELDKVNEDVANLVRDAKKKGWIVVLLTGRSGETQLEATKQQLRENNIPFDYLIMRGPGDYRKEVEYKGEILRSLSSLGDVVLVDDNPEVRQLVSKSYPPESLPILEEAKNNYGSIVILASRQPIVERGEVYGQEPEVDWLALD